MPSIVGIGDTDIDILLKVDRLPKHDEKVEAALLGMFPGGMIGNFLSAAACFGADCGAIVAYGDDAFGLRSIDDLRQRGIDLSAAICNPDAPTFFTVTHLDASGEKAMSLCLTENIMPRLCDIDLSYVRSARYVHMVGTYPHLNIPIGKEAKLHGVKLSLDIEPLSERIGEVEKEETLKNAYIVFPNEDGLKSFVGHDDLALGAQQMLEKGPEIVVVTRGSKGCSVFTREEVFSVPAFRVPVVDSTGAGDTFNGVFLACLDKGYCLRDCAWLATAAAALQIQSLGSRDGLHSEGAVRAFLQKNGVSLSATI